MDVTTEKLHGCDFGMRSFFLCALDESNVMNQLLSIMVQTLQNIEAALLRGSSFCGSHPEVSDSSCAFCAEMFPFILFLEILQRSPCSEALGCEGAILRWVVPVQRVFLWGFSLLIVVLVLSKSALLLCEK